MGPRRTQLLNMGIAGTEPLHWDGDLGVFYHQPYIHTGCAQTLADRFNPDCGGDAHGEVEQLSSM